MTERCTVKKVKRGYAYIELNRSEKCEGCGICAFNKRKSLVVPAVCDTVVSVGDQVTVEMPTKSVGADALLIYAIPLALMVIGAIIGLVGGLWLQIGLCAGGLILGLLTAFVLDKVYRKKSGVLPVVQSVIPKDEDDRTDGETEINSTQGE